ncbi:MAG: hypothetical protein A3A58_01205 [Candidatus Blackburnbacteria bacterium RIFCSPLOWO2_01_FULL_41_27]|uniref:Glycosyltransferase RgtA/B/C/D-like domain-containing protein n=1 Tax=Candidatus Blackburnbacteria bacterium RIFCSPLOWO2_01_FULL_41_27 TaxID=1797520 RepID=A0A1G1VET0_9BACT|nr:MAG: hypothetical protein A3A58_01205 [Candidatus Blackburnbacteria bacterium RIFCSPLOWO2_01_FULL_41_27]
MNFIVRYSAFLLPLIFLIVGLLTLYDYGMNWDSPVHFARGQAYLRYILTGKTNYNNNPSFCTNEYNLNSRVDAATGEVCDRHRVIRVSEYESNLLDFNSWVATGTYGHPAFSDIMLAVSNNIFYKFLGWVEDLNAYHLYSVFTTFLLALTVSVWTKQTFGLFASVVAVLSLYGLPLLFAESHFNVKDPPMAAFFTIALYFFWLGTTRKRPLYLIFSALAGGASIGTKLNFVFAPFVLLPWIIAYSLNVKFSFLSKRMVLALFAYPVIVLLVFFVSWPALWTDPVGKFLQVINYYNDIGGSGCQHFYLTRGWFTECTDITTLKYFVYTVPPFTLLLVLVGSIVSAFKFRGNNFVTLLWLSIFIFTLTRVTLSLTSIYGGLRQIIEFVAPMAMIAGVGALFLRNKLADVLHKFTSPKKSLMFASIILLSGFVFVYLPIYKFHPYQNTYFNSFIGGLKGAAERDFPGYGSTYGSVTIQGIDWLNKNAEKKAILALVSGNAQNISRATLREDIELSNASRSGYNLEGEYQMLSVVGQDIFTSTFRYEYLNKYLEPVYDLKVDGVSLLKIWKNDKDHLKAALTPEYMTSKVKVPVSIEEGSKEFTLNLKEKKNLKALGLTFPNADCKLQSIGTTVHVSPDGVAYFRKADGINAFSDREVFGWGTDFVYHFTGDEAQYIKLLLPRTYQCEPTDIKLSVFVFEEAK